MNKIAALTVACVCCFSAMTVINAAEEKTEIKTKKDGSYKMKIKRKGDKEFVGEYEGKTYTLRGDYPAIRTEGEYTVYGTLDNDYITTTRVEPYTSETVVTTPVVGDDHWDMRVVHRDNHWYGVHEGKEIELRGEVPAAEGEFTVHGHMGDGFITTKRFEHRR